MTMITNDVEKAMRLVEEALWEDAIDEISKFLDHELCESDRETIGRHIIKERQRKYLEGKQDAVYEASKLRRENKHAV